MIVVAPINIIAMVSFMIYITSFKLFMFEQLSIFTEHLFSNTCMRLHVSQTRRQEFPEKVRRLALRVAYLSSRGAITAGPRSPGVLVQNPAQTFGN